MRTPSGDQLGANSHSEVEVIGSGRDPSIALTAISVGSLRAKAMRVPSGETSGSQAKTGSWEIFTRGALPSTGTLNTLMTAFVCPPPYTRYFPSGVQTGSAPESATWRAFRPSEPMTQSDVTGRAFDSSRRWNAICRPSGDHRGPPPVVNTRRCDPSESIT